VVERRRHKRFKVQGGAYARFGSHFDKTGQVINISMGGVAISYNGSNEPLNESSELDLFFGKISFCFTKIPFKTISDVVVNEALFNPIITRLRGVQFGQLTPLHASQLEYVIQNHAIGTEEV